MKTLPALVLFACECVGLVLANSPKPPFNDPTGVATVKQIEQKMGDRMVATDINKLGQIFADDWAILGTSGNIVIKEKVLRDFKSGKDKLVSYALGPMDV